MSRPQVPIRMLIPSEWFRLSPEEYLARFDAMSDVEKQQAFGGRSRAVMATAFARGGLDFDVDDSGLPTTKEALVRLDSTGVVLAGATATLTVTVPGDFTPRGWEVEQGEADFQVVLPNPMPASNVKWLTLDWGTTPSGGMISVTVQNVSATPKRFLSFLSGDQVLTAAQRSALRSV